VRATRFLEDADGLFARVDTASAGGEPAVGPGAERTPR